MLLGENTCHFSQPFVKCSGKSCSEPFLGNPKRMICAQGRCKVMAANWNWNLLQPVIFWVWLKGCIWILLLFFDAINFPNSFSNNEFYLCSVKRFKRKSLHNLICSIMNQVIRCIISYIWLNYISASQFSSKG